MAVAAELSPLSLPPAPRQHGPCALCGQDDPEVVLRPEELSLRRRLWIRWRVVRCRSCSFVYVNPRLGSEEAADIYLGPDYGFTRQEDPHSSVGEAPHPLRVVREIGQLLAPGDLLEVGCGAGDFLAAAAGAGWRCRGVELSPYATQADRAGGLEVFCGTLRQAAFPISSFDLVALWDVIEHLPDLRGELREVHRVLRPGGLIAVETPNWNSVYRRILGKRWAAMMPRLHLYYFDAASVTGLLTSLGFRVIDVRTEIVDLFSPEGSRRGLNWGWLILEGQERLAKLLLKLPEPWLAALLARFRGADSRRPAGPGYERPGPAAAVPGGPQIDGAEARRPLWAAALRAANRPINSFFLRRSMGEQLRVYAVRE